MSMGIRLDAIFLSIGSMRYILFPTIPQTRRRPVVTKTLKAEDLVQFTGSQTLYRHGLVRSVTYSEGAKYVADTGGAYWLLDEIARAQKFGISVRVEPFQVWKLTVSEGKGVLTCEDLNGNVVLTKEIPFTDFPLAEITLHFTDNVISLPSED
jgi:hypothetical protein